MTTLRIVRAKPNPAGKDRNRHGFVPAVQLAAEWVDFQNTGNAPVNLLGIELYHVAVSRGGARSWAKVTDFSGLLPAGHIVRVHAGQGGDKRIIAAADLAGAEHHVFTGSDAYVWNNAEGDAPSLLSSSTRQWIDQTSYDPHPGEGAVLVRSGSKLIAVAATARR
jgi:hypothetical protein